MGSSKAGALKTGVLKDSQTADPRRESKPVAAGLTLTLFVAAAALLFVAGPAAGYYWPALGLSHRLASFGEWAAAGLALAGPTALAAAGLIAAGRGAVRVVGSTAALLIVLTLAAVFFGFLTIDLWTQQIFGAHARQYVPDLIDAIRAGRSANQLDFAGDRQAIQSELLDRLLFVTASGMVLLYIANVLARTIVRRCGIRPARLLSNLIFFLVILVAAGSFVVVQKSGRASPAAMVVNQLPFSFVTPSGTRNTGGAEAAPPVKIAAILPDPYGDDQDREEIHLQGRDEVRIDLSGWSVEDQAGRRFLLSGALNGRDPLRLIVSGDPDLFSNDGDTIHLLSPGGAVVDSIRYPGSAVHRGNLIAAASAPRGPAAASQIELRMKDRFESILAAKTPVQPADTAEKLNRPSRPNVVYLILESFQFDALAKMMPRLSELRQHGLELRNHSSGTNTSHLGLFSLFYGRSPLLYDRTIDGGVKPQVPVTFRQSGYETSFYTSGDCTTWRGMGKFLNQDNFDNFHPYSSTNWTSWHGWPESDKAMADRIREQLKAAGDRPQYIAAFFMSSHFPYSYPPEYEKNLPVGDTKKLFAVKGEETPEHLRNRYRNAMLYMDDLLSNLLRDIDLNKSIVVITGDHGESIWDDGTLTHGSRSSEIQTRAPAVIFGRGVAPGSIETASTHLDLFPTILHLAGGAHIEVAGIQGRDLLDPPAALKAKQSGDPFIITPFSVAQPIDLVLVVNNEKMLFHARQDHPELAAVGMLDQRGFLTGRVEPDSGLDIWLSAIDEMARRFR